MGNNLTLPNMVAIILFCFFVSFAPCVQGGQLFVTWEGYEVDKLASIWLIGKHISPGATIRMAPKGTHIREGIPFDVPDAGIARTYNQSSFDSLMSHYSVQDSRLQKIALLIRDIELNTWEAKRYKKSSEMEVFFLDLIESKKGEGETIKRSNAFFDKLYTDVAGELELNVP